MNLINQNQKPFINDNLKVLPAISCAQMYQNICKMKNSKFL